MRYTFFSVFVFVIALVAQPVLASTLRFDVPKHTSDQGGQVQVVLVPDGDSVNAVQGTVVVTGAAVAAVDDGNSIVNLWVSRPTVSSSATITFSGIIPGGYHGSAGRLFSFNVIPQSGQQATLRFKDAQALRNDGKGTEIPLVLESGKTDFLASVAAAAPIVDVVPPETFTPVVFQDSNINANQWMVAFSTVDKGSGIDRYEVQEGDGVWVVAESPFLLRNQALHDVVRVKAFDKQGNIYVATYAPQKMSSIYKNSLLWCILGVLLLVSIFVWGKRRNT